MAPGGSNALLTVKEAAEYLNISPKTLVAQWRSWEIPAHRVGRALRFRERDLEMWLSKHVA